MLFPAALIISFAVRTVYSGNWAGALWQRPDVTFNSVTGIIKVPEVSGPFQSAATVWIGIGGYGCAGGLSALQVGIDMVVSSNGPAYTGWVRWFPDARLSSGPLFKISAGDTIRITVEVSNSTSGMARLHNIFTESAIAEPFNSENPLCQSSAEWIVEGSTTNLADFGTVTFTNASANWFGTLGAQTVEIYDEDEDRKLTSSSVDGSQGQSVIVQYLKT